MARTRRVLGVTLGLSIDGALVGAICGCLALLPALVDEFVRPTAAGLLTDVRVVGWAAVGGAALGAGIALKISSGREPATSSNRPASNELSSR